MKKEREFPRLPLGFHRLYNYLLLPVSIVCGCYAAYGHLEELQSFSITSIPDALHLVCLAFPFACVLLDLLSFFPLLGYHRRGRKNVMFASTFKALVAIVAMVTVVLRGGETKDSLLYLGVVGLSLLIYLYYLPKGRFFPKGGSSYTKLKKAYEDSFRIVLPTEEESEEEEREEEEPVGEEPEEEEKHEYQPPVVRDRTPESYSMRVLKKSFITPGSFYLEEPLYIKEIRLELLEGITAISFDVYDRSPKEYIEAEWLLNGKYHYVSTSNFFPGDKTTIKVELTEYEDRMHITLLSVTDEDGNRTEFQKKDETEVMMPPMTKLEDLCDEEGYRTFIRSYVGNSHINAKYCTMENLKKNARLCPVCASPILGNDKWCAICGIEATEADLFRKEVVLDAFRNPKAEEEEESEDN